jgi:hypothetical protein
LETNNPWSDKADVVNENSNSPLILHRAGEPQFLTGTPRIGGDLEQLLKEAPNEKMLKNARIMMVFGVIGGVLFGVPLVLVPIGLIMEMSYWSKETMFRIKTGQTTKKEVFQKGLLNVLYLIMGLFFIAFIVWRLLTTLQI